MENRGGADIRGLPENAFRELKPAEAYQPVVGAAERVAEVTPRSLLIGFFLSLVFSGAIAYLTLKIGTGIEAAIPIAIIAVGASYLFRRRSTLLENIVIVAVGTTSGIVTGGAVFTLPAIYIMGVEGGTSLFQLIFIPLFGAVIGALLLIPMRRYFCADMHGRFPFPEATATTEILVAGKKGGRDARVLAYTMAIGGLYDFMATALAAWRDTFSTDLIGPLAFLTTKVKAVFSLNITAAITAMGYIVGVRYASMMTAGGALSWLVLVPLFAHIGALSGNEHILAQTNEEIFKEFVRPIGIGAIFMAGLIGIIKSLPVICRAFSTGFKEIFESRKKHLKEERAILRTDRDIRMYGVVILLGLALAGIWAYFRFPIFSGEPNPFMLAAIALVVTLLLSFLFSSVSAYAIATIGTTPLSGMTMMTLVIACLLFVKASLSGPQGMLSALLVGGVVCTSLSMAGSLVTQFKISYWLGATPRWIQWANIAGSVAAAIVCALVIMMLAKVYGFAPGAGHAKPLAAPQANAMAAVIQGIMLHGNAPWFFYAMGALVTLLMEMVGVAPIAFALGMYLPFDLTAPMLLGALIAWAVKRSSKDKALSEQRNARGTLISSGLMAGSAIIGVVIAFIEWLGQEVLGRDILPKFGNDGMGGNWLSLTALAALCAYMYWDSKRARE